MIEFAFDLLHAEELASLALLAVWAAEAIREGYELGAIAKFAVSFAISIRGCNRRSSKRAAMVAAFERQHPALAGCLADQLEGILNSLCAANVEMHAPRLAKVALDAFDYDVGKLNLFFMEILASQLGQLVNLFLESIVDALVGVSEIDRRIPHLQIEERRFRRII